MTQRMLSQMRRQDASEKMVGELIGRALPDAHMLARILQKTPEPRIQLSRS